MNCLKAVILLWTGIIAFNASVTTYDIGSKNIHAINLYYCGGSLRFIELFFVDSRKNGNLKELFNFFQIPGATGQLSRIVVPYNRTPCDGEKQRIELPVKLPVKQLQIDPPQKEISRK